MQVDLDRMPCSRRGSYLSISRTGPGGGADGLKLRSHSGRGIDKRDMFTLQMLSGGEPIDHRESCDGIVVVMESDAGRVEFVLDGRDDLRVRGVGRAEGFGLRFEMQTGTHVVAHDETPTADGRDRVVVNARASRRQVGFEAIVGRVALDAPWLTEVCERVVVDLLPDETGRFECALDVFEGTWISGGRGSFESIVEACRADFDAYLNRAPSAPDGLAEARVKAAYVNWAATVRPQGLLKRRTMFMSFNWMDQCWSWDHCFNAMALAYHDADAAWDQWLVMFDQQDSHGALPDALNDHYRHFNFCKPPVHGWALRHCLRVNEAFGDRGRLAEARPLLERWTRWWLDHRRPQGEALAHYLHGNDSGWDNATLFDHGVPLVGPDLASFLALQCEALGDLCERLDDAPAAAAWRDQSGKLVEALQQQLLRGGRFVAVRRTDGLVSDEQSLVACMPITLGHRLPADVIQSLVERIEGHVTDHGLATERPDSDKYTPDGYWRGPVWGPSTMLIVDGLLRVDQRDLARRIAEGYCRTCAESGFAENFDALTGAALRDPAYTWTASVFLILAHELLGDA